MNTPTSNRVAAPNSLPHPGKCSPPQHPPSASANEPFRHAACAANIDARVELLELVAENTRSIVFQLRLNPDGSAHFPFISDSVSRYFDLSPVDIYANPTSFFDQFLTADGQTVDASLRRSATHLSRWKCRFQTPRSVAGGRWLLCYALPKRERGGSVLWHGLITDITRRKKRDRSVLQMAYYDALTNLPNRRLLDERLAQAIAESRRRASYSALLFVDLDRFKELNDTHGHAAGDRLLVETATRMKQVVREIDTVARLGGDEFVVILRLLHSEREKAMELAGMIAAKIRTALSGSSTLTLDPDVDEGGSITHRTKASIGITLFRDADQNPADILCRADRAMYRAKESGRDTIMFCDLCA
jgi:diguanylate cyclase (GGDEF)-like protein